MRKTLLVYTLGLLFISNTVYGQTVRFTSLLKAMPDNDGLARFPDPPYRQLQSSSYNRASESPDKSGWFADSDGTGYIREETISGRKEYVIMEHNGPGSITRMWTPFFYYSMEDRTGPNIRVYIDGEETPVLEDNFIRLLTGGSFVHPPFATLTARAGVLYLPIPFARSCKITLDQKPFYYCISYRSYPEEVKVESFTMKDYHRAADLLSRTAGELENPPLRAFTSTTSLHRMLRAGDSARLLLAGGSGAIRYLQFKLDTPLHNDMLRNILLKISFDGHQTVWCPLGDFFCSADEVNTFRTATISVHSDKTLACRWVMPYKDSAVITLVNYADNDIAMSLEAGTGHRDWDERSMYFHADWCDYGYLPGNKFFDLNFIALKGRGVLAGDALTVLSPGTGWWGEGDEKIYTGKSDIARRFPSQFGTGTEDYYGWAGGVVPTGRDTFSIPFGANVKVGNKDNPRGYNICTRNRILDAIPFDGALRFDMEASPGVDIRKEYDLLAYSMITYWYGSPGAISNRKPDTGKIKKKIMSLSGLDALEEGLKSGDILMNDHAVEEKVQALGHSPAGSFFITARSPTNTAYISTHTALQAYAGKLQDKAFLAFPEVREKPVQWADSLRLSWLQNEDASKPFALHAQPGEYFVFQVAVWAAHQSLQNLQMHFGSFKNEKGQVIPSASFTCFNTGGIDFRGRPFRTHPAVQEGQVQALWIGIDLPAAAGGIYQGTVTIAANGTSSQTIMLQLTVSGAVAIDHGFDEAKGMSRLAWLNSTAGINGAVTKGYIPLHREGNTLAILGRSMKIADNGLPAAITSFFTPSNQSVSTKGVPVIDAPFRFIIEKQNGDAVHLKPGKLQFTAQTPSAVVWKVINTSGECDVTCNGRLEFDGFAEYHLSVKAKQPLAIKDIRLEIAMDKDKTDYMMGLNKAGGLRPDKWDWKWDTTKNQDDLWLGAVNGGLRIKWKAEKYVLPLVNVYYAYGPLHLPPSWGNTGKGGVNMYEKGQEVIVSAYSGSRIMQKDEEQHYDFELLITPFKTMDKQVQFGSRYYHSGANESRHFLHEADSLGANIITVHQGNDLYPFINYPYSDVNIAALKDFVSAVHHDGKKAEVYYTTRELTVNLPELWPFLSLNGEVIYPGPVDGAETVTNPQGPDPWLKENLRGRKYIPAWVAHFSEGKYAGMQDLSVITTPDSRLNNFYVAGLDWMVRRLGIDGIYIDDCSLDRRTMQRARKILDDNRRGANINMHSWDHFNQAAGWVSSLDLYMNLLPYIDQLWIGEGRNYNTPSDYWLVEISGIPFGLPGQMLEGGGNPWRGMVYGMTNRAGWIGSPPDPIWRFWDQFDIKDKTMIGYWEPDSPVKTDNDSIRVTVYKGATASILAIGNFSNEDQDCFLAIDYEKLGYDKGKCSILLPAIERYQEGQPVSSLEHLHVPAKKGYLIVVKAGI